MRVTSASFFLGSTLQSLATNVPFMSVGRFFTGVGAGAATVVVPLYISEIAPESERGLFGFMTQITINVGILLTQTLGYYLSQGSLWRIILGVGAAIGLLHGIG
jgi:MFS family permease